MIDYNGDDLTASLELLNLVREFIKDNQISCAEAVTQSDSVIQNSYEFIEKLCDVAGYHEDGE